MRFLVRALVFLIVLGAIGLGAAWWLAGRQPGPAIEILSPEAVVGQAGTLEVAFTAPGAELSHAEAVFEQGEHRTTVFDLDRAVTEPGDVEQATPDRFVIRRPLGRAAIPDLAAGEARIVVTASRPVFYGLRQATTTVTRDVQVRLEPPRVSVLSLHHYINHGGAEFVVYRATPEDVESGVRVGDREYPGFPGTSVGLNDPTMRVAFFALAYDQEVTVPMVVFARDIAGNETAAPLDHRTFEKPFGRSNIEISDNFLSSVVPAIAVNTPSLNLSPKTGEELLSAFLVMNGQLRQQNNETIANLSLHQTKPEMMWNEAFSQLGNSAVQSRFADYRTYFHDGQEIDRQVHLGFDLASTARAPVHAANRGVVVHADYLGIYGNCVIIDHGLGVQSLYAHLSEIDVKVGDTVAKGEGIGRTGATGMAGGDHLHFTMVVSGTQVNPVEWWDPHWMEDRVLRKVRDAMGR
ncbi:MAG: M23 family metallopeptidase [Vicinamibacterales bacterium]